MNFFEKFPRKNPGYTHDLACTKSLIYFQISISPHTHRVFEILDFLFKSLGGPSLNTLFNYRNSFTTEGNFFVKMMLKCFPTVPLNLLCLWAWLKQGRSQGERGKSPLSKFQNFLKISQQFVFFVQTRKNERMVC